MTRKTSYVQGLELEKYPWIYICREQKPFLLSIIKEIAQDYPQYGDYLEISRNYFSITNKY